MRVTSTEFDVSRSKKLFNAIRTDLGVSAPTWGPDLNPRDVAAYRLVAECVRKFEGRSGVTREARLSALEKFLDANSYIGNHDVDASIVTPLDEYLIGEFKSTIHDVLSRALDTGLIDDSPARHYLEGVPGPGASLDASAKDFYHKMFGSAVSRTTRLGPTWDLVTGSDNLSEPLANAFFVASQRHGVSVRDCSSLSVVPKTYDRGRVIATEPSANMWMQRGLSIGIERILRAEFGIDLANQQAKNRVLAQIGSTGTLSTLDLESASDLAHPWVLQQTPSWFRDAVERYRLSNVELDDPSIGQFCVKLNMVSTMGNGFTFSYMTLIMCCVVRAVARLSGHRLVGWSKSHRSASALASAADGLPTYPGNWGVFGDDIIVDESIAPRVIRLLTLLGYKVNDSKSFVGGWFKESCGGDYFRGVDVRPVFIKQLDTVQALFVATNGLVDWAARHRFILHRTFRLLRKWLLRYCSLEGRADMLRRDDRKALTFVPLDENPDVGLRIPSAHLPDGYRQSDGTWRYSGYRPKLMLVSPGYFHRQFHVNVAGLMQAALAGRLEPGGKVAVKKDGVPPRYWYDRSLLTPCWDRVPGASRNSDYIRWLATIWAIVLI